MKLVLASAGFYTPEIVAETEALVGKPRREISVAVINEGYAVEENNLRWVVDALNRVRDNFGGQLELVNLLALDFTAVRKRVLRHDVIFVVGGHTDYLMSVCSKTGFARLLPDLLKTKVYVGGSAGSMILGQRLSAEVYRKVYGEKHSYGTRKYLGLVDFAIKPHFNSPHFPKNRQEILLEVLQAHKGTVYGLCDDAAIIVDGTEKRLVGSQPLAIVNGKVV